MWCGINLASAINFINANVDCPYENILAFLATMNAHKKVGYCFHCFRYLYIIVFRFSACESWKIQIFCSLCFYGSSINSPIFFLLQVQIDNDKCRRERENRLSGSRVDLTQICTGLTRGSSRTGRCIDSHGNSLPPLSPQPINNNLPSPTTSSSSSSTKISNGSVTKCDQKPFTPSGKFGDIWNI